MPYELNSTNYSFYNIYEKLKSLGIKNNKFHLKLIDKDLDGVDPFDSTLSKEMKSKILFEVKNNMWYYIRECIRIQTSGALSPFKLHIGNVALLWCLSKNINTSIILPRQSYKSFSICTYYSWVYLVGTQYSEICYMGLDWDSSMMNLERTKSIIKALPKYLQFKHKDDIDQLRRVDSKITGNRIVCKGSARTPKAAAKIGRGSTQAMQWMDEVAFITYNQIIYNSAAPAQSEAADSAIRNNRPYGKIFSTTPGNLTQEESLWCKGMIDRSAKFTPYLFDYTKSELDTYIDKNSENNFIHIEYSYKDIGRSEKWFKRQCRELGGDLKAIKQEILLQWSKGSGTSLFSEELIDRLYKYSLDPIGQLLIDNYYVFDFYKTYDPNKQVLIGVDISAGLERDSSCITIVDPLTLEVLADFKNNTIDTHNLAALIYTLAEKYLTNCVIIIENNSYGKAIIDLLLKTNIAHKLYYEDRRVKGQSKRQKDAGFRSSVNQKIRIYGTNTNVANRDIIIGLTADIVNNDYKKIYSKKIIDDIAGLERKETGKIEHGSASHDDSLFSYLFVRYIWSYGQNLDRFNIFKPNILVKDPNGADIPEYTEGKKEFTKKIIDANDNLSKFTISNQFIRDGKLYMDHINKQLEENRDDNFLI